MKKLLINLSMYQRLIILLFFLMILPSLLSAKEVLYYVCDINGTPVAMTNERGNVVWRGSALPFGEDFGGTGTRDTEIGYCGKPYNPNIGLYDLGARYYDPNTGRFTSVDPVMGDLQNPQGLNSYAYGLNSPYKYLDPDGRSPIQALYVYVTAVRAAPDFQYDMQSFTVSASQFLSSPSWGGAVDTSLNLAGLLIPAVPGSALKAGRQIISKTDDVADAGKVVGEMHHVASNKALKSGFTKQYEAIFSKAGMSLDDAANKIFLEGHRGGHTVEYKKYVLRQLEKATSGLEGQSYKDALNRALNDLKKELINNPKMPYKGGM